MHQLKFFKIALTDIPKDLDVPALIMEKHLRLFKEKGLNETHFDIVATHLVETLQSLGVAQGLIDEVVTVVGPLRGVFEVGALKYGGSPELSCSAAREVVEAMLKPEEQEPLVSGIEKKKTTDATSIATDSDEEEDTVSSGPGISATAKRSTS